MTKEKAPMLTSLLVEPAQGLKPEIFNSLFAARLKSRPDTFVGPAVILCRARRTTT